MLARHGSRPWESSGQREYIGPLSKTVTVSHTVQHEHHSFRVQVSPRIRSAKSAVVRLEEIKIGLTRNGSVPGSHALNRTVPESSQSAPRPVAL